MGCQDKNFLLDGEKHLFPNVPAVVPYIVDFFLSGRHKEVWQFNPSTPYGKSRPLPAPAGVKAAKIKAMTVPAAPSKDDRLFIPATMTAVLAIILALYFYRGL
jgi:hypothetical protein